MRFHQKPICLKDGREAVLRSPTAEDAAQMLEYLKTTSAETEFVLRYPEECTETLQQEQEILQSIADSPHSLMIACEVDGEIAGNCALNFNKRLKVRHRASIAIALIQKFWGLGIGSSMLDQVIRVAREMGVTQLELEYVEGNERARRLYEKVGFRVIGERPRAFLLKDGSMRSEILMMLELD